MNSYQHKRDMHHAAPFEIFAGLEPSQALKTYTLTYVIDMDMTLLSLPTLYPGNNKRICKVKKDSLVTTAPTFLLAIHS